MKRITLLVALIFAGFTALAQQRCDIFPTKNYDVVPYRIPAIAALRDGSVVCVADYRFSRQDIGIVKDGRIDLHLRRSDDGGKTWGEIYTLVEGKGAESPDFMNVAFGDPCIVADRESNRVMVMSCAGNVAYIRGQRDYHQGIARFYSDDGGKSWSVLGGVNQSPIMKGADEAKVEELPGGGLLISSRTNNNGRNFNIFTFSNVKRGEGSWGEMAHSSKHNGGVFSDRNACNGELMVVPVKRKSDNKPMYLLLQSLPFGPQRTHVGIYYKPLESSADVASPERIAENWEGRFEVTPRTSAYSTMALQSDGSIGFLYEEDELYDRRGGGYSIIYDNFSVEQITEGKYFYNPKSSKKLWKSYKK